MVLYLYDYKHGRLPLHLIWIVKPVAFLSHTGAQTAGAGSPSAIFFLSSGYAFMSSNV